MVWDKFFHDLGNFKIPGEHEENKLFRDISYEGEWNLEKEKIKEISKKKLVISYSRFTSDISIKYAKYSNIKNKNEILDIIQFGNEGLLKAIEDFKLGSGGKFNTFAYKYIYDSIESNYLQIKNRFNTIDEKYNYLFNNQIPKDSYSDIESIINNYQNKKLIDEILKKLDFKEELIIRLRFGLVSQDENFIDKVKESDEIPFENKLMVIINIKSSNEDKDKDYEMKLLEITEKEYDKLENGELCKIKESKKKEYVVKLLQITEKEYDNMENNAFSKIKDFLPSNFVY